MGTDPRGQDQVTNFSEGRRALETQDPVKHRRDDSMWGRMWQGSKQSRIKPKRTSVVIQLQQRTQSHKALGRWMGPAEFFQVGLKIPYFLMTSWSEEGSFWGGHFLGKTQDCKSSEETLLESEAWVRRANRHSTVSALQQWGDVDFLIQSVSSYQVTPVWIVCTLLTAKQMIKTTQRRNGMLWFMVSDSLSASWWGGKMEIMTAAACGRDFSQSRIRV